MNSYQRRAYKRRLTAKWGDTVVQAQGLARLRGKPVPNAMALMEHLEAGGTVDTYRRRDERFWWDESDQLDAFRYVMAYSYSTPSRSADSVIKVNIA